MKTREAQTAHRMTRHVPQQARAPISERPAGPLPLQCLAVPGGDAMPFFVGIDWASQAHAVCVIDETARIHWQGAVAHTAEGLTELLGRLRRLRHRGGLRVALERPSGLLVDTLDAAGLEVVPIRPNALKASRPRYSAAGGKTDPGDAFILADLLRTDGHRFRCLHAPSDETRALRALVRGRDDLVAQRVVLANQLRALLDRFWPASAGLPPAWSATPKPRPVGTSSAPSSPSSAPSWPTSSNSPPPSRLRWLSIPTARSCKACRAAAPSMRPRSSRSSATIAPGSPPTSSSPPRAGSPPSRTPPASTTPSCSVGRATSGC